MKFKFIFLLLSLLVFNVKSQNKIQYPLISNWYFYNTKDTLKYKAKVPGNVFTDLFFNKVIDDPFYGCNSENIQWIEDEDWVYETFFNADHELLNNEHIYLIFEGLDTYAEVSLNGNPILIADNMFRHWKIDIKAHIKSGSNTLIVKFHSATKKGKELAGKLNYVLPEGERVFVRKAQYHFGWDWGPRMVGCGIWKPLFLEVCNDFEIENIRIIQNSLDTNVAKLTLENYLYSYISDSIDIELINNKTKNRIFFKKHIIVKGENQIKTDFNIEKPKYWWTYDQGEPFLYEFKIIIRKNNKIIYAEDKKIGLRKIELINKPDSIGESFYFKLNDRPIYIKGSNYIPQDVFPSRVTDKQYHELLLKAKWSNINLLRVWGGGIYENDIFYNLCDSLGILVWQDFMFACAMYPGDNDFFNNVKAEVEEQVVRLRDHPSIALWCGNNEIDEGWNNWGWQKQFNYNAEDSINIYTDYKKLFQELIPEILKNEDGSRNYWPSSPKYGWGRTKSLTHGDSHYWGVWWGMEPFSVYKTKVPRFSSEYGFQGFPELTTLIKIAPADSLFLISKVLKCHQKHPRGFETIEEYMKREWPVPKNLDDYIYISQLVQAYGIKTAIEAHRCGMPVNMGTLYWQFNDCWPVVSWSGLDYYQKPKALQYFVKNAYEPVLIVPELTDTSLNIRIINETKNSISYNLWIKISDTESNEIFALSESDTLKVSNKNIVYHKSLNQKLDSILKSGMQFSVDIGMLMENKKLNKKSLISHKPKDFKLLKPNITYVILNKKDKKWICLSTDRFAKNVKLYFEDPENDEFQFSDNYFDMAPNSKTSIRINTSKSNKWIKKNLKIKSLYDVVEGK